jgi:hypothetical protein
MKNISIMKKFDYDTISRTDAVILAINVAGSRTSRELRDLVRRFSGSREKFYLRSVFDSSKGRVSTGYNQTETQVIERRNDRYVTRTVDSFIYRTRRNGKNVYRLTRLGEQRLAVLLRNA